MDFINKINYIILDEIHNLNDPKISQSLEKIIHFAQCPMLIMSATINKLDQFYNWIRDINKFKGKFAKLK